MFGTLNVPGISNRVQRAFACRALDSEFNVFHLVFGTSPALVGAFTPRVYATSFTIVQVARKLVVIRGTG